MFLDFFVGFLLKFRLLRVKGVGRLLETSAKGFGLKGGFGRRIKVHS